MQPKLIIFDWDGTLMDSVGRIVSSMQNTAAVLQLPLPSTNAVKDIIGLSLQPAIEKLFGRLSEADLERFLAQYRREYVELNPTPTPFFEHALATLDALKQQGYLLAVATGKMRRGLDRIWQETQTGHYFHSSRCADESESKPSPKMLTELLHEFELQPEQAVMIGDSIYDMAMAAAIEMPRIGVDYGVHSGSQLAAYQPLSVMSDIRQIIGFLEATQATAVKSHDAIN